MKNIILILLLFLTSCSVDKYFFTSTDLVTYNESKGYVVGKEIRETKGKIKIKDNKVVFRNNDWTIDIKLLESYEDGNFTTYEGTLPDGSSCKLSVDDVLKVAFLYIFYDSKIKAYEGLIIINDLSYEKE